METLKNGKIMNKYVILKIEEKVGAKSWNDIEPDKYLCKFVLDGSIFPWKTWTSNIESAIIFHSKEDAKGICNMLSINSPYPLRIEKI